MTLSSSIRPASLPPEILTVIAEALSFEDRYACILVNREWSAAFTFIFYRSVTLHTSRQCIMFYETLLESLQLGDCIRKICIRAPDPPPAMLKELPELCPFLSHLDLSKDIHGDIHDLAALSLNFASLSFLTYICVTSNLNDFSWLSTLSQLKFLSLQWVGVNWSMDAITDIHKWCPSLNTLELIIKSMNIITKPTSSPSSFEINRDTIMCRQQRQPNNDSSTTNKNEATLTLRSAKIYLPVELAYPLVGDWLNYCATKYPNLLHLTIGLEIGHESHRQHNPFTANNRIKNHLTSSMDIFSQSCQKIKSVNLENFSEYYRFLQSINRHKRQLDQLEIRDPCELVAWSLFAGTTDSSKHSLSTLSIASFRDNLPGIEYGLFQHLQTLSNLSSLTLTDSMNRISIDKLLYVAPQLKHLCLVATYLVTTTNSTPLVEQHNSLKTLEFKRNSITQPVIKYINRHCRQLQELIIERTSIPPLVDDNKQQSYISLPNLNLEKISLRNVSRKTVIPDLDSFIAVKLNASDSFKWYHPAGKNVERNNGSNGILGYKALLRPELRMKHDDALILRIECGALQHLYFNDTRIII